MESNTTDEKYNVFEELLKTFIFVTVPKLTSELWSDGTETLDKNNHATGEPGMGHSQADQAPVVDGQNHSDETNTTYGTLNETSPADGASNAADMLNNTAGVSSTNAPQVAELPGSTPEVGPAAGSPEETQEPAGGPEGINTTTDAPEEMGGATAAPQALFPARYPQARRAPGSVVRAEPPTGVVTVDESQGIAFKPTATVRMGPIEFKPTEVIDGGDFDPAEFGLASNVTPPAASRSRQLRDSLAEAVAVAEAGLSVVRPDWRRPGILVTPLHRPVGPETHCYLLVKRGACRCTRRNCSKFRRYMQRKCPGMCDAGEWFQSCSISRWSQRRPPRPPISRLKLAH